MKKICKIIIPILILTISFLVLINNISKSANTERYLAIFSHKTFDDGETIGYGINIPGEGGKIDGIIQEFEDNKSIEHLKKEQQQMYCLKAGMGFEEPDMIETYNISFDMVAEKNKLEKHNNVTYQFANGGNYDKVIYLFNIMYIPGQSTEEYRKELLDKAFKKFPVDFKTGIKDSDINAINQALLWHYTNPNDLRFDLYNSDKWLTYTTDGIEYNYMRDYKTETNEGKDREQQAMALYKYLIDTTELEMASGEIVNEECKIISNDEDEKITLKSKPDNTSKTIKTLKENTKVTRIESNVAYVNGYEWDKIRLEDKTEGYIISNCVEIVSVNEKCKIATAEPGSQVNTRTEATSSSDLVETIDDQTKVTRLIQHCNYSDGYMWDKIKLPDGKEAYVASQYVVPDTDEKKDNELCRIDMMDHQDVVNVRSEANTASEIIERAEYGLILTRTETRVGYDSGYIWDKIKLSDGREGYIATQHILPVKEKSTKNDINKKIAQRLTIDTKSPVKYKKEKNNYVIGPIKITKNSDLYGKISLEVKNKDKKVTNYKILNSKKEEIKIDKLVDGGEIYISLSLKKEAELEDITMNFDISNTKTKSELLASTNNDLVQIVGMPTKESESKQLNLEVDYTVPPATPPTTKTPPPSIETEPTPNLSKEKLPYTGTDARVLTIIFATVIVATISYLGYKKYKF